MLELRIFNKLNVNIRMNIDDFCLINMKNCSLINNNNVLIKTFISKKYILSYDDLNVLIDCFSNRIFTSVFTIIDNDRRVRHHFYNVNNLIDRFRIFNASINSKISIKSS